MPTTQQEAAVIVREVRNHLKEAERENVFLKVDREKLDDEWLYLVVLPSRAGVRASDYANFMSKIECELRAGGDDNVLPVPALVE